MALTITFPSNSMTVAQYDECIRRLEAAGAGSPSGRLFHTCFGPADSLGVVDVWASREQFDQFGTVLMPILADIGVEPVVPNIQPQHNSITGK